MSFAEAVARLRARNIDVAVPQMFCPPGLTHYRALLDVLGIPYLGNPPDVMASTMHKARARAVVAAAGVGVPEGELLHRGDRASIDPPAVVKPADADNSLGVTLVRDRAGYDAALGAAFAHADEVLVERFVELGREVRCGIVVRDGRLVCLPLEEYDVDATLKPVRGYEDKLARDPDGELELMAKDGRESLDRRSSTTQSPNLSGRWPGGATQPSAAGTTACSTSASTPTGGPGSSRPGSTAPSPGRA